MRKKPVLWSGLGAVVLAGLAVTKSLLPSRVLRQMEARISAERRVLSQRLAETRRQLRQLLEDGDSRSD